MQTLESIKKNNAPLQAAKLEEEALNKGTSENKIFSKVTIPFQDRETRDQPGMSGLPPMESSVSGCQNPLAAPFQDAKADLLRSETQRYRDSLMYSAPHLTRELAVDILGLLIKFDKAIDMEDSRKLCDAVNIINRANGASS